MICTSGYAQNHTITGQVTDERGTPLINVTVRVKEMPSIGTVTGQDGTYSVSIPNNAKILIFSYVGYTTKEITITGAKMDVKLSGRENLGELVVVGYGTQKRKDVTGAITSINTDDFNAGINVRPIQQVQGKVAGLVITQANGDPNGELTIRLRGQASLTGGQTPLIVVDGVPLDDPNQLSYISPNDIVSYDVLKDASASAIYGSRAANGVIMVTTKKGRAGRTEVDYSGTVEVDKIEKEYDLLNASEYKKAIGSSASYYDKGGNTDWYKAITRTAITQSHSLAISGGTDKFNYRASGSYIDQQGIVINSGRKETNFNFNAEKKALHDKLDIKLNVVNSKTTRKYADYAIFTYATNSPPTYPVYNADGTYFGYTDFDQMNPVARQMMQKNIGIENYKLISSNIDYNVFNGLSLGITGALSDYNRQFSFFQPVLPGVGNVNNGNKSTENRDSKKGNIHLNYSHEWGKNSISAMAAFEYNYFVYNTDGESGQDYLIESLQDNALQNGDALYNKITSYQDEYKLASILGRITYNYASKYYLTGSFRRDGSSKFGKNNRWGNFPSLSVAWRLSQEEFLRDVSWIDELKMSVGYGVTGNQDAITPYNTLLTLGGAGNYYDGSTGTWHQEYTPNQNQNKDLRWEERQGKNIGLDFSLFKKRLAGNINVYNDKTKNLLFTYSVPVPPFYVGSILANVGDMTNKGLEVQLSGGIIAKKNFTWNASGQIAFIRTRIESLSGSYAGYKLSTDHIPSGYATGRGYAQNAITYLQVGYAPYVFFLPHYLGVNDQGGQLFSDGKGGEATSNQLTADMSRYIDPSPKFNYGLNNTFSYKNWSFNFFLRGVYGQKVFDNTRSLIDNYNRLPGNNVTKEALTNGIKEQQVASDLWLENASYLRLDNVTLSYNFRNIKGVNNLSIFLTGNNLFVITKYRGLDPEVDVSRIDISYAGSAFYPRTRAMSLGVNVSFE